MEETVVSKFSAAYYLRMLAGSIFVASLALRLLYVCLFDNLVNPIASYCYTAFILGLAYVFFRFFLRSWKKITVSPAGITVYNMATRKEFIIVYNYIFSINTYRSAGGRGGVFAQDFVIGFNTDQWLTFSEDYYDNYSRLIQTIYLYKLGPGYGRERYLERRAAMGD